MNVPAVEPANQGSGLGRHRSVMRTVWPTRALGFGGEPGVAPRPRPDEVEFRVARR